ncbi:MAG: NnrU family protein [Chromatiales bacterium]|nr:NnrU family protein [Chromatiales bacterium]
MSTLIAGLLIFFAAHAVRIYAEGFRSRMLLRLGELGWKIAYSLVSLAGLVLIAWGYGEARSAPVPLWAPPVWTRHLAVLLMAPAFILLVAAYLPGTRIRAATGHPMLLCVKIWALAHLLANGTLADLLLFGSFLVWAVPAYAIARRRDRRRGTRYPAGPASRDIVAALSGLVFWALFTFWLHELLFGVAPLA